MPSSSNLPTSLLTLLATFQPLFTAPSFGTFSALVGGFIAQTGEKNVCGMLGATGLVQWWHHSRAHRFFSRHRWSIDLVGLQLAALVVSKMLGPDAAIEVAVDDTLFRRSGRKVYGARWCYDGAAASPRVTGFGNCFVVVGIVIDLPLCGRPVCFPVLFSLWQKGSKVMIARELVLRLAQRFPGRTLHVTGDAAYVSRELRGLPPSVTWTTRARSNSLFHGLTPPRTGKRGRPRRRGERLPSLSGLAESLDWAAEKVTRYGVTETAQVAHRCLLWYRSFGTQPVRLILLRGAGSTEKYDIAFVTSDLVSSVSAIVKRYASRWSIEVAFEEAKQVTGVGDARNRTEQSVRRTVPFGFICQGLLTLWYATTLHSDEVVQERRQRAPWYRSKTTPSTADMQLIARRVLIAAQFSQHGPAAPSAAEIAAVTHAWRLAAA